MTSPTFAQLMDAGSYRLAVLRIRLARLEASGLARVSAKSSTLAGRGEWIEAVEWIARYPGQVTASISARDLATRYQLANSLAPVFGDPADFGIDGQRWPQKRRLRFAHRVRVNRAFADFEARKREERHASASATASTSPATDLD